MIIDENDDTLDAWDDFTGSTGLRDYSNTSSQEEPVGTNLFSAAGNAKEIDFGAFRQPDLFSGTLNSQSDLKGASEMQSEASTMDRFGTQHKKFAKTILFPSLEPNLKSILRLL